MNSLVVFKQMCKMPAENRLLENCNYDTLQCIFVVNELSTFYVHPNVLKIATSFKNCYYN